MEGGGSARAPPSCRPPRLEHHPAFEHAADLLGLVEELAELGAGRARADADVGELGAGEEDALLVGRRQRQRPGVAAGAVEQVGAAAGADPLDPASQAPLTREAVLGQPGKAVALAARQCEDADRRRRDIAVLAIGGHRPFALAVVVDQVEDLALALAPRRHRKADWAAETTQRRREALAE